MGGSQKQLTWLPRTAPTLPQVRWLRWEDQAGLGAAPQLLGGSLHPRTAPWAELPGSPQASSLHLGSQVFIAYLSFQNRYDLMIRVIFSPLAILASDAMAGIPSLVRLPGNTESDREKDPHINPQLH